jgi:outer membrane biogenesis lipoprotein LolB
MLKSTILLVFASLLLGCSSVAHVDENTWSDTSSVTIQKESAISHEERYEDPLYYYHNGFDYLYFN